MLHQFDKKEHDQDFLKDGKGLKLYKANQTGIHLFCLWKKERKAMGGSIVLQHSGKG